MPFSLKFPWKIPPEDPVSGRLEPFYAAAKVQSTTVAVNNGRLSRRVCWDKDGEMPTIQNVQSSFSWTMHLKCTVTEEGPAHTSYSN